MGICGLWYMGNRIAKSVGYSGLGEALEINGNNLLNSKPPDITIELEIDDASFELLAQQRDEALNYGMMISAGEYVPAIIKIDNREVKVEVRLKGHMTDHLEGEKWSFRVKTDGEERILGMERFSLQHPGTRGYINEYIHHKLMQYEGVMALNYQFVALELNGKSLGVYALEEHFGKHVSENNERPSGPILRFEPGAYWEHREDWMNDLKFLDEPAKMLSAPIGTYAENAVYQDIELMSAFERGAYLLEGFRRGEFTTSQVFDIDKLARFHAILDLIGGWRSLDWSDVKYYYNSATGFLEPVAYESFSGFEITRLVGQFQYLPDDKNATDIHTLMFSDVAFYKAYISNVSRISQELYWEEFWAEHGSDIEFNMAVLHGEFTYKQFDMSIYNHNQEIMQELLTAYNGLQVFLQKNEGDVLELVIGNADAFPYQLDGVSITNELFGLDTTIVIEPKKMNKPVLFQNYALPIKLPSTSIAWEDFKLNYHLLGSENVKQTIIYPYSKPTEWNEPLAKQSNVFDFADVTLNENTKEITFEYTLVNISSTMVIPAGYTLTVGPGTTIDFTDEGGIVSYSPIIAKGTGEEPILFLSSDSTAIGLQLIDVQQKSFFKNVQFANISNEKGAIQAYKSAVRFDGCSWININGTGVSLYSRNVQFYNCLFKDVTKNAIAAHFSSIEFEHGVIMNSKGGITLSFSDLDISDTKMDDITSAIEANFNSSVAVLDCRIENCETGVIAASGAEITVKNSELNNMNLGFSSMQEDAGFGGGIIKCVDCQMSDIGIDYNMDEESTLSVNGIHLDPNQTMIDRN